MAAHIPRDLDIWNTENEEANHRKCFFKHTPSLNSLIHTEITKNWATLLQNWILKDWLSFPINDGPPPIPPRIYTNSAWDHWRFMNRNSLVILEQQWTPKIPSFIALNASYFSHHVVYGCFKNGPKLLFPPGMTKVFSKISITISSAPSLSNLPTPRIADFRICPQHFDTPREYVRMRRRNTFLLREGMAKRNIRWKWWSMPESLVRPPIQKSQCTKHIGLSTCFKG